MQAPVVAAAFLAGALLAAQGPIYGRLTGFAGGPVPAAIFAFATALVFLLAAAAVTGQGLPRAAGILKMPGWLWLGGLIGASMVLMTMFAVPRIGVGLFIGAVVAGQLLAAMAYDHTGAFGIEVRRAGLREIGGAALMLAGLALIASGRR